MKKRRRGAQGRVQVSYEHAWVAANGEVYTFVFVGRMPVLVSSEDI
jgi:hypothetical protein